MDGLMNARHYSRFPRECEELGPVCSRDVAQRLDFMYSKLLCMYGTVNSTARDRQGRHFEFRGRSIFHCMYHVEMTGGCPCHTQAYTNILWYMSYLSARRLIYLL
jgi:hypothetical protein